MIILFIFFNFYSMTIRIVYKLNENDYIQKQAVIENIELDNYEHTTPQIKLIYSVNKIIYTRISYLYGNPQGHNIDWMREKFNYKFNSNIIGLKINAFCKNDDCILVKLSLWDVIKETVYDLIAVFMSVGYLLFCYFEFKDGNEDEDED